MPKTQYQYQINYKIKNKEKIQKKAQEYYKNVIKIRKNNERLEVIYYYSNGLMICECCGESIIKFLGIDHVENDGNKHRKSIHMSNIYHWLITNGFPEGFRVLCHNCNFGRYLNGGICPHRRI